jgi:hypothetical protein
MTESNNCFRTYGCSANPEGCEATLYLLHQITYNTGPLPEGSLRMSEKIANDFINNIEKNILPICQNPALLTETIDWARNRVYSFWHPTQ